MIKLQEVEWFATREPEIALQPTAEARRAAIRELRQDDSDLADEFERAKGRADQLGKVIRSSGDYPLLGRGDINLYSLFVERARNLVKPHGFVGLLTPSGIYGDQTAANFFKQISTRGNVYGLFDFENRKIYFKDVPRVVQVLCIDFRRERTSAWEDQMRVLLARLGRDKQPGSLLYSHS